MKTVVRKINSAVTTALQELSRANQLAANKSADPEAGFNEFGIAEHPKVESTYATAKGTAKCWLWAQPHGSKWVSGYEFAINPGDTQCDIQLPSKDDEQFDTASQAIGNAVYFLRKALAAKYPDLEALVKTEAKEVEKVRAWLTAEIKRAHTGAFDKPLFTFIDAFAGIGGAKMGLVTAGGRLVAAIEKDPAARETYLANYDMDGIPFFEDITEVDAKDVPDHDVMAGGFPCQPFSGNGKQKGFDDDRGTLLHELLRIIKAKLPKLILLENVPAFCTGEGGEWSLTLRRTLAGLGYAVHGKVLDAADFGTAQVRRRVFYVAYRRDLYKNIKNFVFPVGTGGDVCVADILEANVEASPHKITNMVPKKTLDPKATLRRIGQMKGRDGTKELEGQQARVYDIKGHAATLMATQQNCGLYLTDSGIRALIPRERATLQGFPKTFAVHPTMTQANKQFGNSIAVPVVNAIAKTMVEQFFKHAA